ncbi:MAG TPA: STY0301 family protein [Aliidongia sp.]|uniref:STY0301 family protein n=1 Tax=Aliidongia sp. TaxID=1914230 RepID=UPI002DDD5C5D|nr:STY0301 family protein [Aliidongia sp.]HEV2674705.1 STY0301 family protein [Aliidongia sp.]
MKARFLLPMLAALSIAGVARAEIVPCPDKLAVEQRVTALPQNWGSFDSEPVHGLAGVSLSEGNPSELATLVPTTDRRQGKVAVTTWTFIPSKEGYWLSCLYAGTSMAVTRKLPDGVKSCRVESDAQVSPPLPTKIDCR